ncbi:MAG: CHASE2 domain-containing protein [Cyanobacteria bacterium J06592_8]
MLQLYIQKIEQLCLFELTSEQGQRQTAQIPFETIIIEDYQEWHRAYINFYQTHSLFNSEDIDPKFRGKSVGSGSLTPSATDWKSRLFNTESRLINDFNQWLRHQKLYEIRVEIAKVCRQYASNHPMNLFLICGSPELEKLPWESWEIGDELANVAPIYISRIPNNITAPPSAIVQRSRPRILAIIGQDGRLNFQQDLLALQKQLKPIATVKTVGWKPGKSASELETEIKQAIIDEKGWDVLFFAGHSNETPITGGELGIAPGEFLQIQDISSQLEKAKKNGLQFALFNSCNGLKIAESLINLGLKQVAVMREPIHNQVAQEFLLQFLQNLAQYKTVQESLISACNFLKVEKSFTYPSAHLIPSLFCYPHTQWFQLQPSGWRELLKQFFRPKWYEIVALATLSILSWQVPVQYQLLEQRVGVQALYRDITGQISPTQSSLLLVKIDDESLIEVGFPDPLINRKYLAQLIDHAAQLNRDVVGVDYVLTTVEPEEDQVLKTSLDTAIKNSKSLYIFATSRNVNDRRLWTLTQFADKNWQGDTRIWENGRYMTLLPLPNEERPFPLSYLLALAYTSSQSQPNLQQQNPVQLTENLFYNWMRPSVLTMMSYHFYQYWLHPIVDFSIPVEQVFDSISAKEFLETSPEKLQQQYQQPVIMIIPGGYSNAGLNKAGEDNLPPPPGFCYWQRQLNSQPTCRVLLGGEIHAFLFHHFLNQKPIISVPDLWLLWFFVVMGKGVALMIERSQPNPKKIVLLLIGGTLIYGIISLQMYASIQILLPVIIPTAILWIYLFPYKTYTSKSNY